MPVLGEILKFGKRERESSDKKEEPEAWNNFVLQQGCGSGYLGRIRILGFGSVNSDEMNTDPIFKFTFNLKVIYSISTISY